MGHILHWLNDLTGIIWVILSKKNILHRLLSKIYILFYLILKLVLLIPVQSHPIMSLPSLQRQMCIILSEGINISLSLYFKYKFIRD